MLIESPELLKLGTLREFEVVIRLGRLLSPLKLGRPRRLGELLKLGRPNEAEFEEALLVSKLLLLNVGSGPDVLSGWSEVTTLPGDALVDDDVLRDVFPDDEDDVIVPEDMLDDELEVDELEMAELVVVELELSEVKLVEVDGGKIAVTVTGGGHDSACRML